MVDFRTSPTVDGEALARESYVDSSRTSFESFAYAGELAVIDGRGRFAFPVAGEIIRWTAAVGTAPTGSSVDLRLNRNGTAIDVGSIAAGASSMATQTISESVSAGDYVTVDITAVGSSTPGEDLTVVMVWRPSLI